MMLKFINDSLYDYLLGDIVVHNCIGCLSVEGLTLFEQGCNSFP